MFPTTRWTLILEAKSSPEAKRRAFEELAAVYWRPLFVYLRSRGLDVSQAQDAVQELLLTLMQRDVVEKVDPQRGRLRAYLKTAAANLLANAHERSSAQKRGANARVVEIDAQLAERLPHDAEAPELAFEREWALLVMQRGLGALKAEFDGGARKGPWALIERFFRPGPAEQPSYADAAREHGMSLPQLKAFLHRARVRYRELIKEQVRDTVDSDAEAEVELGALVEVLSR